VLCQTYGVDPAEVLAALPAYMSADLARMSRRGTAGVPPWSDFLARADDEAVRAAHGWLRANAPSLA